MNPPRREFLKTVGALSGLVGIAGCGAWAVTDDDEEGNTPESDDDPNADTSDTAPEETNQTERQQNQNNESSEHNETDENMKNETAQNETEQANETEQESTEDVVPDEEETRPNETEDSDPDSGQTRVDEDTVEIEDTTLKVQDYGATQLAGSVRNVSDVTLSVVTLEIIYFDADGNEIGAGSDTVRSLEPGDSDSFGHSTGPDQLRGEPYEADVIPRPYVDESDDG